MRRIPFILTTLALVAMAFVAPGCGGGPSSILTPDGKNFGAIRFINASPNAPGLDALINGAIFEPDLVYGEASDYIPIRTGTPYAQFVRTGTDQTLAETEIGIAKKGNFTLLAVNPASTMGTLFVSDDYTAPTTGNVRVRFIHAAPGAGAVDIYVTAPGASLANAEPAVTDLPYLGNSGYLEAPAGTYQVRICPTGTKAVAIDSGPLTTTAGQVLSGFALGDPAVGVPFSALVLQDRV